MLIVLLRWLICLEQLAQLFGTVSVKSSDSSDCSSSFKATHKMHLFNNFVKLKVFFSQACISTQPHPNPIRRVCCYNVSVIVNHPVLLPCVAGHICRCYRNPLYCYYLLCCQVMSLFIIESCFMFTLKLQHQHQQLFISLTGIDLYIFG